MEETRLLWPAADLRGSLGFPPSLDPHRFTALLVIQQTLFGCLLHAWHSSRHLVLISKGHTKILTVMELIA